MAILTGKACQFGNNSHEFDLVYRYVPVSFELGMCMLEALNMPAIFINLHDNLLHSSNTSDKRERDSNSSTQRQQG